MAENKQLKIGNKAPDFKLPDASGKTVTLEDYRDKWLVLYFYPEDNTSGCTIEAIDFTGSLPAFKDLNAYVAGVSPDSCKSHQMFIETHDLAVTLLSDELKAVLDKYGVWQEQNLHDTIFSGVVRTTFIIDPEGKIRHIWENVKVEGHIDQVLEKLKELQKE